MDPKTLRRIERDGTCTHRQRNALAAAIDIDPRDLTLME